MVACFSSEFTCRLGNLLDLHKLNRKNPYVPPTPAIMLPWEGCNSPEILVGILGKSFCSVEKHTRKPTTSAVVIIGANHALTPQSHPEGCLMTQWAGPVLLVDVYLIHRSEGVICVGGICSWREILPCCGVIWHHSAADCRLKHKLTPRI